MDFEWSGDRGGGRVTLVTMIVTMTNMMTVAMTTIWWQNKRVGGDDCDVNVGDDGNQDDVGYGGHGDDNMDDDDDYATKMTQMIPHNDPKKKDLCNILKLINGDSLYAKNIHTSHRLKKIYI